MNKILLCLAVVVVLPWLSWFKPSEAASDPKPWPQYACDIQHSSIAQDTWDYQTYRTPAWILTLHGTEGFSRSPVVDQGVMAIADTERVYCVDVISGKQKWATELMNECGGSCAIIGDKVLVPTKGSIVAYDMTTGEAKSSLQTGDTPSSPSFYQDETTSVFYFGVVGKPGYAEKFNNETGRRIWMLQTEWGCPGAIGVNIENGYAGIASHYKIYCADEGIGTINTEQETGTQSFAATSAIGDFCVYTMSGGETYLLPKSYENWNPMIIDCGGFTFWPPAQYGQTLVQGNRDGRLVRFDLTGKIVWDVKVPAQVTGGTTVMGDLLLVPVGGTDNTKSGVYIMDAKTGTQVDFINIKAQVIYQPVVAWQRLFVEYGKEEGSMYRWVACYGKQPRTADSEPKLSIKDGKFNVEVGWMGEVLKQVTLSNDGKVPIDLLLTGEPLLVPTVDTITIAPKTSETLRVKVLGKNRPGKYSAKINCHILDPDYGDQSLGFISANITIKDTPPPPPAEQPPNPPQNLQARVVYDYIQLEWQPPGKGAEPVGYNIFRTVGTDPFPVKPINVDRITDLTYSDKEVIAGLSYTYKVVALGKAGLVSDPSNTASAEIPIKLVAVKNLKAVKQGDGVLLTWESDQPVTFVIERDGEEVGMTASLLFTDPNPPVKKIIYKVFPKKDTLLGPETFVIIDLSPEKPPDPKPDPDPNPNPPPQTQKTITIEFTIGKEIALVNGVATFSGAVPYVSSGRTMVPFRFLGESIGAKVSFTTDPKTGKVLTVTYDLAGKTVTLVIGSKTAVVGDTTVELDAPPEIKDGKTYVPLRFVTTALGGTVDWNATTKTATIKYTPKQ